MPDPARAIQNLLFAYAERIDLGDLEGVGELFTHGRIAPVPGAAPEQCIEGKEAVTALYRASTRLYEDGTPRTKHVTSNSIIEIEDGASTASARSYYTVLQQLEDLPLQPIITGRYHDTFHVVEGRWWFDTRTMLIDQRGDLSRHLLFELP
jgi:3-phenylpropionate/cinnamic acid dioxygenase small subunit